MSIDTSTTAGKIAVMQHYEGGGYIQSRMKNEGRWSGKFAKSTLVRDCDWNWEHLEYRVELREFLIELGINAGEMPRLLVDGSVTDCRARRVIKVREVIE